MNFSALVTILPRYFNDQLAVFNRAYDEAVGILLGSFHEAERKTILVRLSFGLGSPNIRYPLT